MDQVSTVAPYHDTTWIVSHMTSLVFCSRMSTKYERNPNDRHPQNQKEKASAMMFVLPGYRAWVLKRTVTNQRVDIACEEEHPHVILRMNAKKACASETRFNMISKTTRDQDAGAVLLTMMIILKARLTNSSDDRNVRAVRRRSERI